MALRRCTLLLLALLVSAICAQAQRTGQVREINGYTVLTVEGSPADIGRQHGELLGERVRRVVQDVVVEGAGAWNLESLLEGADAMEAFLPPAIREELQALAEAAQVDYRQLVALQLFGDIRRAQLCTGYAVFGPATLTGECICGRNMDYWDYGASEYAAILVHYKPANGYDFLTCSWAGIINGWTALNERGIVCSNNSAYGGEDSLEGLSTCFMVRKVAQFAGTVDEGIAIVEGTPRACGTNLLIAGGEPPDAAIVEYDHEQLFVRRAKDGCVAADNSFLALEVRGYWTTTPGTDTGTEPDEGADDPPGPGEDDQPEVGVAPGPGEDAELDQGTEPPGLDDQDQPEVGVAPGPGEQAEADEGTAEPLGPPDLSPHEPSSYSRAGRLVQLMRENYGRIDRSMNFAAAPGVPIRYMNLHSALIFVADRAMYVSMGEAPAADQPYRGFRLTPEGIVGLDIRHDTFPAPEEEP